MAQPLYSNHKRIELASELPPLELTREYLKARSLEAVLFSILGGLCALALGLMLFGPRPSFIPDRAPASEPATEPTPEAIPFDPRAFHLSRK